ncbi:hypothetical protein JCM19275_1403 [Nonlabens ulvanivorans]|uniref:Uncharacterized protein n=1 Tax=Nonlabens ulvanivorans TaxID=906888 RepID=A0A090WII1_NONUL|nr:hypothetical protein [Nonlabens ulvanivorans]GAL76796.1 hypothetical protein JCM19275_1403 [Nonlabens ulvanivorans]
MNWNNIEKSWNEFAEFHNVELIYVERNLFHAIECKYQVDFKTEYGKSHFLGILWKSTEGHNRNRTIISTEFINVQPLEALELKNGGILNLFSKNKLNDFEKNISWNLKKLKGKSLLLKDNVLEIELNGILSSISDFEKVTELIKEIKTSR